MITQKELEDLGFIVDPNKRSPFFGDLNSFSRKRDNRHIIEGHDTTEVFITKERDRITIEIDHRSSYDYAGKRIVFRGRCETIEFFTQVLNAVLN